MRSAKSPATLNAYRSDFADFTDFCRQNDVEALPTSSEIVALYLVDRSTTLAAATLSRRLTAINQAHRVAGITLAPASTKNFVVAETLKGIRRTIGTARRVLSPLLSPAIRAMVECTPQGILGARDRALILTGFVGAFRGSELAALNRNDLEFCCDDGVLVTLRRSKTDAEASGRKVGLPWSADRVLCPVRAIEEWLTVSSCISGPLFVAVDRYSNLSDHALAPDSITRIIQRAVQRAGIRKGDWGSHSLRAGFVTQASLNHATNAEIHHQTGHSSDRTLERYRRIHCVFAANAASSLGI
jgi:integrase